MSAAKLLVPLMPVAALAWVLGSTGSHVGPPRLPEPAVDAPAPTLRTVTELRVAAGRPGAAEDAAITPPPPTLSPEPPGWAPGEEERHFKWLRETSAAQDLERELEALCETLHEQCAEEIRARVASGEFERISTDEEGRYPVPLPRRGVVEFVSGGPDLGLVRVPIPEAAVPAAYETQRRIDWLRDLLP